MVDPAKSALLTLSDIEALLDLKYLIGGILPAPVCAVLFGPPGVGKLFVGAVKPALVQIRLRST